MKKIFLLLILISAYSCKKNESETTNGIITNKKDTTSFQKKAKIKLESANTYDCYGEMFTDSSARILINLPQETDTNKYTFKVYNTSDQGGNKLIIHLKDNNGVQLNHRGNLYNYSLNFGEIIKCKGALDLDINEPLNVVVFHENSISDTRVEELSSTIYRFAQNHSCGELRLKVKGKTLTKEEMYTPKTCGLGTIRPYY